jgi:hypothetical protein
MFLHSPGAIASREREVMPSVIASEAKQSNFVDFRKGKLDCFAPFAMTIETSCSASMYS